MIKKHFCCIYIVKRIHEFNGLIFDLLFVLSIAAIGFEHKLSIAHVYFKQNLGSHSLSVSCPLPSDFLKLEFFAFKNKRIFYFVFHFFFSTSVKAMFYKFELADCVDVKF